MLLLNISEWYPAQVALLILNRRVRVPTGEKRPKDNKRFIDILLTVAGILSSLVVLISMLYKYLQQNRTPVVRRKRRPLVVKQTYLEPRANVRHQVIRETTIPKAFTGTCRQPSLILPTTMTRPQYSAHKAKPKTYQIRMIDTRNEPVWKSADSDLSSE